MAKFLENTSDINRSIKKKKKKQETVTKPQSPSAPKQQRAQQAQNQKTYGGMPQPQQQTVKRPSTSSSKSTSKSVSRNVSQQTQRTVDRLQQKYGTNNQSRTQSRTASRPQTQTKRYQPHTAERLSERREQIRSDRNRTSSNQATLDRLQDRYGRNKGHNRWNEELKPEQAETAKDRLKEKFATGKVRGGEETKLDEAGRVTKRIGKAFGQGAELAVTEDRKLLNKFSNPSTSNKFYNRELNPEDMEKNKKKLALRDEGLRQKILKQQEDMSKLEAQGGSYLERMAIQGAQSAGGMAVDALAGPMSLVHMGARVTEGSYVAEEEKVRKLRQRVEDSGQYTPEEIDEMFKDMDKRIMASALSEAAIEVLTEKMFGGIGMASKVVGGKGFLDAAASKLTGRLGASVAGRMLRGTAEEIAEEEIGNPAQAAMSNLIMNNRLNEINQDVTRRGIEAQSTDLISRIGSEEDARAVAANLNSESFLDEAVAGFRESGASKKEAQELAEMTRDYLYASVTGDTEKAEEIREKMVDKLAGEEQYKEKWTLQDAIDVAVSTGLMTAATGAPGAITSAAVGANYKSEKGAQGVKKLAELTKSLDPEKSARAQAVIDRIDSGKDVSNSQVYEIMSWSQEATAEATKREQAKDSIVRRKMEEENLLVPASTRASDGSYMLSPKTEDRFEQIADETMEKFEQMTIEDSETDLSEEDKYTIADAVAAFQTGTITAEQINELNYDRPAARKVFKEVTGIDLDQYNEKTKAGNINEAASNVRMQEALFARAAENYVESARAEQAHWDNVTRGEYVEQLESNNRMGSEGSKALTTAIKSVDPRDQRKLMRMGAAANSLYERALYSNDSWEDVRAEAAKNFSSLDISALKAVFDSGKADRAIQETAFYGRAVKANEKLTKKSLAEAEQVAVPGEVVNKTGRTVTADDLLFLQSVADTLHIKVEAVDIEPRYEGWFTESTGVLTVNLNEGVKKPLRMVVTHELTHSNIYAPDEFMKLLRYIGDAWYKADPAGYKAAIDERKARYKKDQELNDLDALEEIVADGSIDYNFWNDEDLAATLATEDPGLAQKFLNAIRELLRKIRSILADQPAELEDDRVYTSLYADAIDMAEAERLMLNALKAARQVRNENAIEAWDEAARNQTAEETAEDTRLSVGDDYTIQDGNARWTDERIDDLIERYGASNPDYSQAYAVLMNPRDFLHITMEDELLREWRKSAASQPEGLTYKEGQRAVWDKSYLEGRLLDDQNFPLDEAELRGQAQTPFLYIRSDKSGQRVLGHEGRHRMRALMEAGVTSVPVVIEDPDTKTSKQNVDSMILGYQEDVYNGAGIVEVNDLVPIKESNRDELIQKFGGEAQVRFSIEEAEEKLEENFDEYKEDKENLRIAAEALSDLQDVRYSVEENTSDISGRWSRGEQVRTIGKGITADLVNEGYVEFRGRKVKGPEDLAKLCQVLRDPRFETFRVVLTKGDKIVSLRSISSRLPGLAQAFESENISDGVDIVRDRMKRTGADGYYLIHNHPSGNVTASFADLSVTKAYLALLGQDTYKGHIILDHDKYGFIDADVPQVIRGENFPTAREESITGQQTFDLIHEPEIDHPLLGEEIHGHADIAKCGQFVNASDDVSVLLYTNSPGEVTGIQEISNKTLKNNKEITGFIRNQGVEFGAASAFLYTTDIETYQASKDLVKSGHLVDSVVAYGNNRQWSESAREVVSPRADVEVLGQVHDDVIRRTHVFESATGATEYKYSLPETDNEGKSLTEDQRTFFRNVAPELLDENGNIKRYFHGTARADRVGYYFNPERATSGPMAYFTDNRDIATNYSRDKADTSLAYEGEDINDYHNQFVVDVDGEEVRLEDYWYQLPANKKLEYRERAGHITYDYDGEDDTALIINENVNNGNGGYGADPYLVRQSRGNVFRMLIDAWLDSGDFFNEEERFLEVMDLLGMEGVRYKDPNYRDEKVYEVYLNVTNPLVTTELDEEFAADVEDWLDATDLDYYARESASADMWDKNDRDPYDWLDALRDDIENGTTHVWTSIPDVITDFLKEQGYDGIVDQGGKYHEAGHQVVIPFEPNQIKLTTNEHPTEDVDIRYSIAETDSEGNFLSDGQRRYFNNSLAVDEQGRLVPVYHSTNKGGFTVFDPWHSDDKRSLFFSSSFDVSTTYVDRTLNKDEDRIGSGKPEFDSWDSLINYVREQFEEADLEWDDDYMAGNLDWMATKRGTDKYAPLDYDEWLEMVDRNDPELENYSVEIRIPYIDGDDVSYTTIKGDSVDELLRNASNADTYETGYYQVYLNLENPLVVDAMGANWDAIPYGDSQKTIRNYSFYLEPQVEETDEYLGVTAGYIFNISWEEKDEAGNWAEKSIERNYINFEMDDPFWFPEEEIKATLNAEEMSFDFFMERMQEAEENPMDGSYSYESEDEDEEFNIKDQTYRTRELAEIAQNDGHDGVIIRNCRDLGGVSSLKGNPISDIFIAFSSEQVKDTRNTDPTNNPDIRYSLTEEDDVIAYASENAESTDELWYTDPELEEGRIRYSMSKQDFIEGKIRKWNPAWLTEGRVLEPKSVEKSIREVVMGAMAQSDTPARYRQTLVKSLVVDAQKAFAYMKDGKESEAAALLYDSAHEMIESAKFFMDDDAFNRYNELRDYFSNYKISIEEKYYSDIDIVTYRRNNMRNILIGRNGTMIDEIWEDLCDKWPEYFSMEVEHPVEMLEALEHAFKVAKPVAVAYSSEEAMDFAGEIADDLYDIVYEGKELVSLADKYQAKAKAMKQRHKEAMQAMKQKLEDQRERHAYEVKSLKEENRRKLKTQKSKYEFEIAELKQNREYNIKRLKAENRRALKEERQKRKDEKARKKAAMLRQHMLDKIGDDYNWLVQRVLDPTKDKYVPEEFRKSLAEFLQMLDLQTENSKKLEAKTGRVSQKTFKMRELKDRLENMAKTKNEDGVSMFELDSYVPYILESLTEKTEKYGGTIDSLDVSDVKEIGILMKAIRNNLDNYNKRIKAEKAEEISEIAANVVSDQLKRVEKRGAAKKYGGTRDTMDIINTAALTPVNFFDRLGPAMKSMYDELRYEGFDAYVRNEQLIIRRLNDILGKYHKQRKLNKSKPKPGSTIEEWRDDRSLHTIQLKTNPDKTIEMTTAQIMSLYCLQKRKQALQHMLKGGIHITPIQSGSKIQKLKDREKGKVESAESVPLTIEDIQEIVAQLTPEQKQIADDLQQLMAVDMAKLGNQAHREMYGYEIFDDPEYFPIKSRSNEIATDVNNVGEVVEKIKSFGPAKPLDPKASNIIEVDDIFSVVADHCNGMNLYNAYLVPISDFVRVYNAKIMQEDGRSLSVKDALEMAHGKKAMTYINNFLRDINGIKAVQRGGLEDVMNKALGIAKRTAVFGNIRVALQQPTAIVRALAVMDPKHFVPFLKVKPQKGVREEMYRYCPIAQWKSWGFYDTYMGRDIEDVMMNNWSGMDVALSGIYGELDNWTWSLIWRAVKAEQAKAHPDMDTKSEEFLQMCGRRASEVFDRTQVVDSTFHRSDAMRSKQVAVKTFTAFMAEPTLTLNVFRAGIENAREEWLDGNKGKAMGTFNRAFSVIILQAAIVAAAQSFADAWRDKDPGWPGDGDDDDKEKESDYWTRWVNNYVANLFDGLHLENNIYLVKDITPYFNFMISKAAEHGDWNPWLRAVMGWDQEYLFGESNLVMSALENTATGVSQIYKKIEKGDEYEKTWYDIIQKTVSGPSTFLGFPLGTLMRDTKPIWTNILGVTFADDGSAEMPKPSKQIEGIEDGSTVDNILNHFGINLSPAEQKAKADAERNEEIEKQIGKISDKASGLTGLDKDKKIWSAVTTYYKDDGHSLSSMVESGNFSEIYRMQSMYTRAGGDSEYFVERVMAESKKALKKSIIYDPTEEQIEAQRNVREYLLGHGMSEQELSDIVYKSDTAREMKIAFRLNDKDAMMEELKPLVMAGLTYQDLERLWENRKRVNLKTYNGKYKDRLKSTGTYNWPINGQITSRFGHRSSPGGIGSTNHQGLDIAGNMGDPVGAADGGTVIYSGWYGGAGKTVMIEHDDGTVTQYSHLSWYEAKVGDVVAQGQTVGNVGSTGNSTGPHLHFGVKVNGSYVDPLEYLNS